MSDSKLIVNIYDADTEGKPIGAPKTDPMIVDAEDAQIQGFKSVLLNSPLALEANKQYCLVVHEVVPSNSFPSFEWYSSSIQDNTSKTFKGLSSVEANNIPASWTQLEGRNFYYKVFYNANPTPQKLDRNIDFTDGDFRGCLINKDGKLVMDARLAAIMIVDDTTSFQQSLALQDKKLDIQKLINILFSRTMCAYNVQIDPLDSTLYRLDGKSHDFVADEPVLVSSDSMDSIIYYVQLTNDDKRFKLSTGVGGIPLELSEEIDNLRVYKYDENKSYVDFWIYNNDAKERTNGFVNIKSTLLNCAEALYNKGDNSNLYSVLQQSIVGLAQQSLVDAIVGDENNLNKAQINKVVKYLDDNNLLRLNDIIAENEDKDWNGSINTIANYYSPSALALKQWAKSFIPAIIVVSDGDYTERLNDVIITANSLWDDSGVPILSFGVGHSQNQDSLRQLANETNGKHFDLNNSADWDAAIGSLLHGGANNLFTAKWTKKFDFDQATWIKNIVADCDFTNNLEVNSECIIKVQYTKDRINWTNWQTINPKKVPFVINDLILGMNINIEMKDGWNGFTTVSPTINSITYSEVIPSRKYLVTKANQNNGMILEYILSASVSIPKTAQVTWGIVRGDSTDFADYDIAINKRKSVLPNRQYGIKFTSTIVREKLTTRTTDLQTYYVYEADGTPARWTTSDKLTVYVEDITPKSSTYSVDGEKGIVYFSAPMLQGMDVTVTIETPSHVIFFDGEPTYTKDYRTYYLTNGRWPKDASCIVLINSQIVRGGYWTSPDDGTITFDNERESDDIVSVYIQHTPYFRVGMEILNYDETQADVQLQNLGLYFTELTNSSLINNYLNSPIPALLSPPRIICNSNSVFSRMTVDYTFNSSQETRERNSTITWWRIRNGVTTEISDYKNRLTEKMVDVGVIEENAKFKAGDEIYVQVTPSDGINIGQVYESPHIILTADNIPVAWDPIIVCPEIIALNRDVVVNSNDNSFVTTNDHGFQKNETIGFVATVYPNGLKSDKVYYVIPDQYDAKKFRITAQYNGNTPLDITSNGMGVKVFAYTTYVPITASLQANYQFKGGVDKSVIKWYLKDNVTTPFYTGKTIPSGTLASGQSISFTVTPCVEMEKDGKTVQIFGYPVTSSSIEVKK